MPPPIRIIGIPMDLGQALRGVDMGPGAVRYAGLKARLERLGYAVEDTGNIDVPVRDEMTADKPPYFLPKKFSIPAAFTVFPGEIYQPSRRWAEGGYSNLAYFNEVDKGGHFAAWEQPQLFAEEVRAAFRSVRG